MTSSAHGLWPRGDRWRGAMSTSRRRSPIAGVLAATLLQAGLACPAAGRAVDTRCWIDRGVLVAPAAFGDIAGDFIIDLSAPVSQLHATRAAADGLDGPAVVRDLVIAGRRVVGFPMVVADLDERTRRFDTTINGVLGADLFGRFVVDIAPSPCRIRLTRRVRPATPRPGRLAVRMVDGRPLIAATVTDGRRLRPGLFALDTAHWATTVVDAGLSRPVEAVAGQDPPPVRLRGMEMAGRLFEQVPAVVDVAPAGDADGAIGMAVLTRWRLRLDMADGWLKLTKTKGPDR